MLDVRAAVLDVNLPLDFFHEASAGVVDPEFAFVR